MAIVPSAKSRGMLLSPDDYTYTFCISLAMLYMLTFVTYRMHAITFDNTKIESNWPSSQPFKLGAAWKPLQFVTLV